MAINKDISIKNGITPLFFVKPEDHGVFIIVSKKNFPLAVARNKAKRRIRSALAKVLKEKKLSINDISLKINAQKSVIKVQFQDIVEAIESELIKRKFIK